MSIYIIIGIFFVAIIWLGACFFNRRKNSPDWPLWLGLITAVSCIILLGLFGIFHNTRPISRDVTEETLWMTSTGNEDHCLVMRDGKFYFSYVDYNKLKKGEADVKDSSVFYSPDDDQVVVKTIKITERQTFLFLRYEEVKTEVKYEFHIPGREMILFDFENRQE